MAYRFKRHYTREQARALLPRIRQWLTELRRLRDRLAQLDKRLAGRLKQDDALGGPTVNDWVRCLAAMRRTLLEFPRRDLQVKDLDRGLVDFPAVIGGREVFLCWEEDEDDIEFWHDLEAGYAGREHLEE